MQHVGGAVGIRRLTLQVQCRQPRQFLQGWGERCGTGGPDVIAWAARGVGGWAQRREYAVCGGACEGATDIMSEGNGKCRCESKHAGEGEIRVIKCY